MTYHPHGETVEGLKGGPEATCIVLRKCTSCKVVDLVVSKSS